MKAALFTLLCMLCASVFAAKVAPTLNLNTYADPDNPGQVLVRSTAPPTGGANVGTGCPCDPQYDYCTSNTYLVDRTYTDSTGVVTVPVGGGFDVTLACGSFYTGRPWMAPQTPGGTFSLISKIPAVVGTGSTLRNGFVVNPADQARSNLDGRLGTDSASPALPYTFVTGTVPISSLVLSASWNNNGPVKDVVNGVTRMSFDVLEEVTILDSIPAGYGKNHIRPAIFGNTKDLRTLASFDKTKLPAIGVLSRPSGAIAQDATMADALAFMEHLKIDWVTEYPYTEQLKAYANWPGIVNGYSPYGYGAMWRYLQMLYLDPVAHGFTQAEKDLLFYRAMEHGMDVLEIVKKGTITWLPNGGHAVGRYGLGLLAAVLSTDAADLPAWNAALSTTIGPHFFAETGQISASATWPGDGSYPVYGGETITGGKAFGECTAGINSIAVNTAYEVDIGDFNQYPTVSTYCLYSGFAQAYQDITFPVMFSEYIVLSMIPDAYAALDPEYKAYMERMYATGTKVYTGDNPANAVTNHQIVPTCNGGTNDTYASLSNGSVDCPGGTSQGNETNFASSVYLSKFNLFMYDIFARGGCIFTSTCEGQ